MKTYWKSEAPDNSYYIRYVIDHKERPSTIHEFWTDNEEDYYSKLGFIERHYNYQVLTNSVPSASL